MIRCLLLHTRFAVSLGGRSLCGEFPSLAIGATDDPAGESAVIDVDRWEEGAERDFAPFESVALTANRNGTLAIAGGRQGMIERATYEVMTRFQRYVDRRNVASATRQFDSVLHLCAALHSSEKPLVVADRDHAFDAWQWVLRLDPGASFEVQVAALFHDVERLVSEPDARIEHLAPDYQAFKDAHARGSAAITGRALARLRIDRPTITRVEALLASHEHRGTDPESALLADADALSFFSLNSPGYVDYFGVAQARRKIRYTLGRLGPGRRPLLARMKLRRDVRGMLAEELSQFAVSSGASPA
jgi:hypothetical protein